MNRLTRNALWGCVLVLVLGLAGLWSSQARAQSAALLLYGGSDHKTFLGCLNCSKFDSSSICNQFGQVGSQFDSSSIWNQFGHFGSQFSNESPWNAFSSQGPVIVDRSGKFYGRFSANKFVCDRTRIEPLNQLADLVADGTDLDKARDLFCDAP
jgi:hypothetical protein